MIRKQLGEIINLKRGYDLPARMRKKGVYPVISSSGISGYHSEFKVEGEGLVTGRYGTLGEVYYVDGKYWPHNTALYVTDFKGNYPKYVYFLLKQLGNLKTADKSTVPGVNRNDMHTIMVPYIEPNLQKPIADCLFQIEKKIELIKRTNATLEATSQTLYDYWFVQFDFPDAKGKPYRASDGELVDWHKPSYTIPKGWSVGNILSIAELYGGGTPPKSNDTYWGGEMPFFTPADSGEDIYCTATEDYITPSGIKNSSTKLFNVGTIFITARGSVGKIAIAGKEMGMNQSCYAFAPREGLGSAFVYFSARQMVDYLKVKSSGSVFNSIVTNDIKYTPLVIPPDNLIKQYDKIVAPLFVSILKNTQEIRRLSELHDWLLPMFINGQIKASEDRLVSLQA